MSASVIGSGCLFALALACAAAGAAPDKGLSPGERPAGGAQRPPLKITHGLCDGPSNAEAFPSSPVATVEGQCENVQEFKSTSPTASYGSDTCGGYTAAFGPQGQLKPTWKKRMLRAAWAGPALTAATCGKSRIAAIAWGWRCSDAACSSGTWEKLGGPLSNLGKWNGVSKTCNIAAIFWAPQANTYATLSIDAIATQHDGSQWVRQRVAMTIRGESPNGKCPTATYTPQSADPPAQAASEVKINKRYP